MDGLRGDDESKSGPVLEALEPLMRAAGEGLAVLIPLTRKQPNRRCSYGCGRPGRYLGRLKVNGQSWRLGYFATQAERTAAREAKRREVATEAAQAARPEAERITVSEYTARYLARYERECKASSYSEARCQLTL